VTVSKVDKPRTVELFTGRSKIRAECAASTRPRTG
jgi:hypothetical protein